MAYSAAWAKDRQRSKLKQQAQEQTYECIFELESNQGNEEAVDGDVFAALEEVLSRSMSSDWLRSSSSSSLIRKLTQPYELDTDKFSRCLRELYL